MGGTGGQTGGPAQCGIGERRRRTGSPVHRCRWAEETGEHDGTLTVLADRRQGKRLNSPNDAAVKSDGSIWFSDPDFGITSDYERYVARSEIGASNVYRVDPGTGEVRLVADGFGAPNGLVLSHDERQLFVSDPRAGCIRVFDVRDDGTLSDGRGFAEARARKSARFDNLRFDDGGRLWAAAMTDGVHCYAPDGTHPTGPGRRPWLDAESR